MLIAAGNTVDPLSFGEEVFMTLSKKQSDAVWRRVNTLNATVRVRQQKQHTDVRDVFTPEVIICIQYKVHHLCNY